MENIIAILLIAFLVITYIVLYLLNRRTPVPEEYASLFKSSANCASCNNSGCGVKSRVIEEDGK